jgi:hypothetical protein
MFFLIRCVFWLTVVYTTIFSPNPAQQPASRRVAEAQAPQMQTVQPHSSLHSTNALGQMVQHWLTAAFDQLEHKATGPCGQTPDGCMALAQRLSDFARAHANEPPLGVDPLTKPAAKTAAVAASTGAQGSPRAHAVRRLRSAEVPLPPLRPRHLRQMEAARL